MGLVLTAKALLSSPSDPKMWPFLIRFARISQTPCLHFLLAFVSIFGASFCKRKLSGCSHEFSEILGDKDHTKYMYINLYTYISRKNVSKVTCVATIIHWKHCE